LQFFKRWPRTSVEFVMDLPGSRFGSLMLDNSTYGSANLGAGPAILLV
jgi:hypothetical protein